VRPPWSGQNPHQCVQKSCFQLSLDSISWRYGLFHFGSFTAPTGWSPGLQLLTNQQTLCLLQLVSSHASWGSRMPLPQSFLSRRWARTPHKGSESPSPSLPPPLHLAEQWEQQVPSGCVVVLCPELPTAMSTHPQAQQEPCQVLDGSSTPASQGVPQLLLHQASGCGRPGLLPRWG